MKLRAVTMVLDLRRLAAGQDIGGAGGEVDHRRHPAGRHQAEDRHHRAIGIRQHHADRLAEFGDRHQFLAEDARAEHQPLVGERAGDHILGRDAFEAVFLAGGDQRFRNRAVGRRGLVDHVRHDVVERGARRAPTRPAFQRRIEIELDRLQHRDRQLREQLASHLILAQARERRALQPVDADRNDGRVRLVGDQPGAVIDLHQRAGDGEAAFRKDDQRLAALHGLDQRAGRHRLQRIDRHGAGKARERLHPPFLRHRGVDRE